MRPGFCQHRSVERHTFAALVPRGKKLRKVEGTFAQGFMILKEVLVSFGWCLSHRNHCSDLKVFDRKFDQICGVTTWVFPMDNPGSWARSTPAGLAQN